MQTINKTYIILLHVYLKDLVQDHLFALLTMIFIVQTVRSMCCE